MSPPVERGPRLEGACEACGQPMDAGRGCTLSVYLILWPRRLPSGRRPEHEEGWSPLFDRWRFGDDHGAFQLFEMTDAGGCCAGCGVAAGQYHHPGCWVERCPCNGQATTCGCQQKWAA
ncbi:MAG TPA: hypothetical protein VKF59_10250 [Candidatus Dormibacteraeota bacterium]|nr:hypothetical protein [Candidatus Dormibacteraeota bacterium]